MQQLPAAGAVFDPTASFYLAQDARPAGLEPAPLADLTPLQRALLVIDGTVTAFLEAWALEPVAVERLWQRPLVLPGPDPWLGVEAGGEVMSRGVLLAGCRSGSLFAYAESLICPERLPAALGVQLAAGTASLGQILLAPGFDSRREGLWFGRERPAQLPEPVAHLAGRDFLSRTYRVTRAGQPLMRITERFPWRPAAVGSRQPS